MEKNTVFGPKHFGPKIDWTRNFLMQSSSGLINIHELRWLGDWLVVPASGRGRQAGP